MNKLDKLLIKYNISPNYRGYEYIKEIITQNKPVAFIKITELYKDIARKFSTTPGGVERAIRVANSKSNFTGATNKKFLAMLQVEYKGEN